MTAAAIAARDNVTRQAVSKHVKHLRLHHGLDCNLDASGRVCAINVADYDRLLNRFLDTAKQRSETARQAPSAALSEPGDENTLDAARLQNLRYQNERARLDLAERRRDLVRFDIMVEALARLGEEIGRTTDLTSFTDSIAAAYEKDGIRGLRIELKRLTVRVRTAVTDHCAAVALASPEQDQPLGDTTEPGASLPPATSQPELFA